MGIQVIKSFYETDSSSQAEYLKHQLKSEIENKDKDYLLNVDEDEFKKYLYDKYSAEPLCILDDSEVVSEPYKKNIPTTAYGMQYENEVYVCNVTYSFTGSPFLFRVRPNPCTIVSHDITVDDNKKTVAITFFLSQLDENQFKQLKNNSYKDAFENMGGVNQFAEKWNNNLMGLIESYLSKQKSHFLKENQFFKAINVKVNKETASVFTIPTIKKKIIPQPAANNRSEYTSEPSMSNDMYKDVLKVIYDSGKNMEKKPSLYISKDEEGLRDQFLFVLETRYEGTTATGETFNRAGKTDILLKYAEDGSNLFVAECKFWHGISEFQEAIYQLFERYLTWRDSKTALIIFVTNKDFSNVISKIQKDIIANKYFVKSNGQRGETSYSYIFKLPQDDKKPVYLEVMLFHYDKTTLQS